MLHRLYLVRSLADSARQIGFTETQKHLIPILEDLMPDPEPSLRQAVVEQIPELSKFFVQLNDEEAYTIVLHILIPMVAELTTDRHLQVRSSATDSLIQLAGMIKHEDLEAYLLPIVKSLSNDATEEEHRLEAAQVGEPMRIASFTHKLLATISPLLGTELREQFVLPLVLKLAEDRVFRVRKAIAANFGEICNTSGPSMTLTVLVGDICSQVNSFHVIATDIHPLMQ